MSGRLGLALFLLMMTALVAPAAELFVAPDGSDDNVGTKARPFATIQRAQEAVRDVAGKEPVTVNLRAGTYYLTKPVVFGAEDSGAVNRIVVYKAYEKEKVRVSGGKRLSLQWQEHKGGIKKAKISRAIIESAAFDQFFVNGQRRHKARFPNRDPDAYVFDGVTSFDQLCRRASRWQKPHTGFMHAIHIHRWGSLHY
ncbi:MAG: peptide-binding protein, partial [Planctomycetota bacterium]